jgi:hypothetical protein
MSGTGKELIDAGLFAFVSRKMARAASSMSAFCLPGFEAAIV